MQRLGRLDMAMSSARNPWLMILKSTNCNKIDGWYHSHSSMRWVITRNILVRQILVNSFHRNSLSDLTFRAVCINSSHLLYGEETKGDSILSRWGGWKYLESIDLRRCPGITDIRISALGQGCGQLQTFIVRNCPGIIDIGISALGHGCSQLHTIDLSSCQGIADNGISTVGRGCGQLHTINLSSCQGITDIGISALGHGCGELQWVDLSGCRGVTDIGISALRVRCNLLSKLTSLFQS
jgi:Leucine Rich repeat